MTDLERKAREAADQRNKDGIRLVFAETPHSAYMRGYLAAAEPREKEIAELRAENAQLRAMAAVEEKVEMAKEIAALRAKLASIPSSEIARGASALRLFEPKLADGKYAGDTIDRWLAELDAAEGRK